VSLIKLLIIIPNGGSVFLVRSWPSIQTKLKWIRKRFMGLLARII